jgi:hypothetical protein
MKKTFRKKAKLGVVLAIDKSAALKIFIEITNKE